MLCPFCKKANKDKKYVKAWNTKILQHLVVTLSKNKEDERVNWHVHGPINNKQLMEGFLKVIAHESKLAIEVIEPAKEIITMEAEEVKQNEAEAKTE